MKVTWILIALLTAAIKSYPQSEFESKAFFGISDPFTTYIGIQTFNALDTSGRFGLLTRGDIYLLPGNNVNNRILGNFLVHFAPGIGYRWYVSEKLYLLPKIGPSVNIYLLPNTGSNIPVGFGIATGIGMGTEQFEVGLRSNVSFATPQSFSNWIAVEIGWLPRW
jgi:hypothetical protein